MSFEVICVDGVKEGQSATVNYGAYLATKKDEVYEGQTYTVVEEVIQFGEKAYVLAGKPCLNKYRALRFIRTGNVDEAEFLTQEDKMLMAIVESMPEEKLDPVAEERILQNLSQIFGW